jgi:predicted ester cyclase
MSAEDYENIVRNLGRLLNTGDLNGLNQVFASDHVRHDPNPLLEDAGIEEYRQASARLRTAFPDARWVLEEILADGDRVIGRWSFRGTHNGPLLNISPTGKDVKYPILAIYRIEDGRIAEDWHILHSIGLWQELIPEIQEFIERATQ